MEFTLANEQQWANIKEIYLEAFPKQERKPYFILRRSVKKGKAVVMTATEGGEQRVARRRFYLKNGFTSSDIFIEGVSGELEVLNYRGKVSQEDYICLQRYALGELFFKLSKIKIVK